MIYVTEMEAARVDLNSALAESRAAMAKLIAAGEKSGIGWTTPRAAGKWSPSQVIEHVARALEESGKNMRGQPNAFPTMPVLVRPVIRGLFFNRILRKNTFPNARTNKAMNPIAGPPTPADGRARLQQAHALFERACKESGPRFNHGIFGDVSTADYARFQALHMLHHVGQIPGA